MTEHVIDRRNVLRGAGIAAGGAAIGAVGFAGPASASSHDHHHHHESLSGSWLIVRQDDGTTTPVTAVLSFAAGNVVIEHDINPAGPPFTGTWEGEEHRRFDATFWTGTAGGGPNQPGQTIRVHLHGRVKDDNLTARYRFTVFDASGQQVATGTGKVLSGRLIDA
jgi:hypothetical protein